MNGKAAIVRQQFVTWYKPDEKIPPEGHYVFVTFSGTIDGHTIYEHAPGVAAFWYEDEEWELEAPFRRIDNLVIHAWADLELYQGGEWKVSL